MKWKFLVLSFLYLGFLIPVAAEAREKVTVSFAYSPPLIYIKDDRAEGLYADVLRQIFEENMGHELAFVQRPWKRSQRDVELGRSDLMITVPTSERLAYTVATELPVYVLERKLFTSPANPRLKEIAEVVSVRDLQDLGLKLTTNIGDGWYRSNITTLGVATEFVPDLINSFLLVADGRADAVIASEFTAKSILEEKELHGRIVDSGGLVESPRAHILISQKSDLAKQLPAINSLLEALTTSGQLDSLKELHLSDKGP